MSTCFLGMAHGQEQEKKLLDRLLKPDTTLTNHMQTKQFAVGQTAASKEVPAKQFYVPAAPAQKEFGGMRSFVAKIFGTGRSRHEHRQAILPAGTNTTGKKIARDAGAKFAAAGRSAEYEKVVATTNFPGTKPFRGEGKSQKRLSTENPPMTIDQVRELLNRNR